MNVIAVDVGTTSVRLAIVTFCGELDSEVRVISSYEENISHRQDGSKYEQSSAEVWQAICKCSRECLKRAKLPGQSIKGIAFSATCSLVVVDAQSDELNYDIIMWMDHRAIDQAQRISDNRNSKVLEQFGGVCSPEFSLAKLVWLKEHRPDQFDTAEFFELPDWLVYKCIGGSPASCPRSLCCVTCKWGYDADTDCHCDILSSLDPRMKARSGDSILKPGAVAGFLNQDSAAELGLCEGAADLQDKENFSPLQIAVGASLIDAHSGMLAMLSVPLKPYNINHSIESTFCSLAGSSSCHMLLSEKRHFRQGIWGPYKDVVIDGYHLLEAGQSLAGKLIELIVENHEEGIRRIKSGERVYDIVKGLNNELENVGKAVDLHMLPSFHGNRSPLANPRLRGAMYGLTAERPSSLLEQYIAAVESLVYEVRFIVETFGIKLDTILVSGGLMKNTFYMQTLADVLRCNAVKMSLENVDFMVIGSALVARQAASSVLSGKSTFIKEESIRDLKYNQLNVEIYTPTLAQSSYHEKKYLCYREFVKFSQRVDEIMHDD